MTWAKILGKSCSILSPYWLNSTLDSSCNLYSHGISVLSKSQTADFFFSYPFGIENVYGLSFNFLPRNSNRKLI